MVPSTLLAGASWALASLASVSLIAVATAPVVVADYLTNMPFAERWVDTELNCFSPMLVFDPADPHATVDKGWHMTSPRVRDGDGDPIFGADVTVATDPPGRITTTMAGASVSVTFSGRNITFFGTVGSGTKIDVSIDGVTTTPGSIKVNNIIFYTNPLDDGNHTVSITLVSGQLDITGATFSTPIQSQVDWTLFPSNKADTVQVDENQPLNASLAWRSEGYFEYEGRWENLLQIGGQAPNGTADLYYAADYAVVVGYPGSSLKFGWIGSNQGGVNWFQVMGVTTVRPASVTISIDPPPPFGPASTSVDVYRLFATAGVGTMFGSGVCDPSQNCTITVTVDEQDADPPVGVPIRAIRVRNTTFEDANGQKPTMVASLPTATTTATVSTAPAVGAGAQKKTNVGAIAGGVVGGIGALAIIGALVWFCLRRRRKAAGSTVTPKSPVDLVGPDGSDPEMARVSPFRTSATHARLESPPYETPMTIGSMGRHTSYFDTMGRNTSYFDSESGWTETTHTDSNASSGPRSIFSTTTSTRPLHNRNYSSTTDNHFSSANDHETMETVNEGGGPGRDIEQEYDAGRLVEVVPPTYNPAWAAGDLDAVAPRPGHPGYETPSGPPSQPPSQARSPPPPIVPLDPDTKIWPRNSRQ